jgi:hypothetical protein
LVGHGAVLHDSKSFSGLHVPPHDSNVCTVRERERVPVPHAIEHDDQFDHMLTVQSTGQQLLHWHVPGWRFRSPS